MIIYTRNDLGLLLNALNFVEVAEIGVQRGLFSKTILSKWTKGHLTLIDSWENMHEKDYTDISNVSNEKHEDNFRITLNNIDPYIDRCTVIKGFSNTVYKEFSDEYFDLVYLDANHKYESVYEDISLWINKVKSGGYICGHDYLDGDLPEGKFGVKSAVKDFFKKDPDFITQEAWPSWFIKVQR